MEPTTTQPPIDQTALALSRSIRNAEGGDYNNYSGDAGTSAGAYQWNNGKLPLKQGEIPANFKSAAQRYKLDPNDFSQTNQDHVAYAEIKGDLDSGLSQSQIAAKWNSGLTHGWENHKGTTTINGKTVTYDTPAYVAKVQKYYEEQLAGNGTSENSPTRKTFADELQSKTADQPDNLKTTNNVVTDLIPGYKLAQGLGYGIAQATGSQKGLINATNRGIDIESQLLDQIKKDKAKGKDTTRLEKALKELIPNIQNSGNNVSDVGTGGISSKDVLSSATSLASLPAMAYAGSVLNGTSALESGVLGSKTDLILNSPKLAESLKAFDLSMSQFKTLSNVDKVEYLTQALKNESSVYGKKAIQQALDVFTPMADREAGLAPSLVKQGLLDAGKKVGSLAKGAIKGAGYVALGAEGKGLLDKITK